jgi:exopolysaccharide transport family protein
MAPDSFEFPNMQQMPSRKVAGGDLHDFITMLRRRLRMIMGVFAVVAVLIVAYTLLSPRLYEATATIMINPRQEQILSQDQSMSEGAPNTAVVDSELEVLRSRELAQRLVQTLELDARPNWNPDLRAHNSIASLFHDLGGRLRPGDAAAEASVNQDVVDRLTRAISVKRRALSFVIDFSVTSRDPREAAWIANQAVDAYLQMGFEARVETTHRASGWLEQRLRQLRADVQEKEGAAQGYRAETGLLTSDGVTLTETQISDVQSSVLAARADLAEKEARYRQVEQLVAGGGVADTISGALSSNVIRDLRQREADLQRQRAEYQSSLGPMHPDVIRNQAELEDVHRQIRAEIERIRASLAGEVQVARARLATLEGSLNAVQGNLATNDGAQVHLRELEREADASRTVYESFLQRFHELSDQGRLETSDIRIVSNATPPDAPSSPNILLGVAVAIVVGLLAGVGVAVLAETIDDGVKSAAEAEQKLGVPTIVSIPVVDRKALRLLDPNERHPAGFVAARPMSGFAEAFRVMKTAIAYSGIDERQRVLAIASALPGEGKTTCALSLARIAAMGGMRVLLIDCDLRRHSLNQLLNIAPERGLLQVLAGEERWQEVVGYDEVSDAHILPIAPTDFTPRDVFGTDAMRQLLSEVRELYDIVILDCPPVLALSDARVVAALADRVVMIVRWNKTSVRTVGEALDQLESNGAKVLGLSINCFDPRAAGMGYYADGRYYQYGEEGYYTT